MHGLYQIRGFWGDIVCSPYFSFGIDCETPGPLEQGVFEIMNKVSIDRNRNIAPL
jgi:hypothetical protein